MGHVHAPDRLHTLLAFLLLLQQLALTGDITAVALGKHVLAKCLDVLAGNNARTHRSLDGDFELLTRDEFLQALRHSQAICVGLILVDNRAEGIHAVTVEQNVDLHQVGDLLAAFVVVQRGITASARLQVIEEIEDNLCQGQLIVQLNAILREVVHSSHGSTAILAQLHNRAREFSRSQDRCVNNWLANLRDLPLGEF